MVDDVVLKYMNIIDWNIILNESIAGILSGLVILIIAKLIVDPFLPVFTKKPKINEDKYTMTKNIINNENSPGSINTIGQDGNNTINNIVLGNKPRIIDNGFKNHLLSELNKLLKEKDRGIVVGVVSGADGETVNLYNQIKTFLIKNNLPVRDGMTTFHLSGPVFGVKINLVDPENIALIIGPKEA